MRTVHLGPVLGLIGQVGLLVALDAAVGLGWPALVVAVAYGLCLAASLDRALSRRGRGPGPADRVTLSRAVLVGGVTALTVQSFTAPVPVGVLASLASVALLLDAVDGGVARRTATQSPLGARFDMEVDAFLILVLSVYVAPAVGWWVLVIGGARYLLWASERFMPWLRRPVPPRYWRKVVAAVQGVVLTVATTALLPAPLAAAALVLALTLLGESFGRDVRWLWTQRREVLVPVVPQRQPWRERGPAWAFAAGGVTVLAAALAWVALLSPDQLLPLHPEALVRIPIEGLVVVPLALALRGQVRTVVVVLLGVALGVLAIVRILDAGFTAALGRPFHPVTDWGYLDSAVGLLSASVGRPEAVASLVAAAVVCVGLLVLLPLSLLRVTEVLDRHRRASLRTVTALAALLALSLVVGFQVAPGTPIASASAGTLAYDQVRQVRDGLEDEQRFAHAVATDAYRITPGPDLLTGLRGKDVLFVFIESYGRVAVDGASFSPEVGSVLDVGTRRLDAAGFGARSAYLTSPTFGGISWLAHSTLQSGLWVDTQQRYDHLVASDRLTLSGAFARAGWRTVADVPSNERDWPEGRTFYGYDTIYDGANVGYEGPSFSYAAMPDQYTLSAFQSRELSDPAHPPVMAEIDLVSSHTPWAPLPRMVDWTSVGDGSIFDGMPEQGQSPGVVWRAASTVRAAYAQSIAYSLDALVSFIASYGDDDLVLVVLGDHQPATIVSGSGAGHDVPVSVIAHDPAVLDRIGGWGWTDGLRPGDRAPVWGMDAFRDRFLRAYGSAP